MQKIYLAELLAESRVVVFLGVRLLSYGSTAPNSRHWQLDVMGQIRKRQLEHGRSALVRTADVAPHESIANAISATSCTAP